jgi:hypothetical protein
VTSPDARRAALAAYVVNAVRGLSNLWNSNHNDKTYKNVSDDAAVISSAIMLVGLAVCETLFAISEPSVVYKLAGGGENAVEEVARTCAAAQAREHAKAHPGASYSWDDLGAEKREEWRQFARTAICAIQEHMK